MNEEGLHMKELKLTESQLQELVDTYDMHFHETEFFLNGYW
jgi:penicillin V acylase-like amidase (Ntn superfamily)